VREEGAPALHRLLAERDAQAAAAIHSADAQRIVRALEVLEASGRPISHWQKASGRPVVDASSARLLVIAPDRDELARRISRRFDAMVENGALDEARAIGARGLDPALPAMKAIGLRELLAAGSGEITLDEAVERAAAATRQYARRQMTWFRNQLGPEWQRIATAQGYS
jgi:tRNA dimethylallyltransferase